MVEPLAQIVKGSITRYPVFATASKVATAARRTPLSSQFFTPRPRQWNDTDESGTRPAAVNQCREWSTCTVRHSLACSNRDHSWDLDFDTRPRGRGRSHRNSRASHRSSPTLPGQRRHASQVVLKTPSAPPPPQPQITPRALSPTPDQSEVDPPEDPTAIFERCCKRGTPINIPLEQAWTAYRKCRKNSQFDDLPPNTLANFAGNLMASLENKVTRNRGKIRADEVQQWVRRIESALNLAPEPVSDIDISHYAEVKARLSALGGDLHHICRLISERRREGVWPTAPSVQLYKSAVNLSQATGVQGEEILLELCKEPEDFIQLVLLSSLRPPGSDSEDGARELERRNAKTKYYRSIRQGIGVLAGQIKQPLRLILTQNPNTQHLLFAIILRGLLDRQSFQPAYELVLDAHHNLPSLVAHAKADVVDMMDELLKELGHARQFLKARTLIQCFPSRARAARHALVIASLEGKPEEAEEIYASMEDRAGRVDKRNLLLAYANARDIPGLLNKFNSFYPVSDDGIRDPRPPAAHYYAIIVGLTKHQPEDLDLWLRDMESNGVIQSSAIHSLLLKHHSQRGETASVVELIADREKKGLRSDLRAYNDSMAYFARRKDVATVESIFKRMTDARIRPNAYTLVTLMNAYVEAGVWPGVIRVWKYWRKNNPNTPFSTDMFNVVLKAYVHFGARFGVILDEFWNVINSGHIPSPHTYTIVLEAAWDARMSRAAESIFDHCLAEHEKNPLRGLASVQLFTIMITGYNQTNRYTEAMEVVEQMAVYGIQPNSYTYGAIVRGMAGKFRVGGAESGEEFVAKLLSANGKEDLSWRTNPASNLYTWEDQIFGPLFHVYRRQPSPNGSLRLFRMIMKSGGKATRFMLTSLMGTYGRAFHINGVLRIWPELSNMIIKERDAAAPLRDPSTAANVAARAPDSSLCIPLSIYIDAVSRAGLHHKVHEAWNLSRDNNCKFDERNWTSRFLAFIRAGEVNAAFEILDRVILVNHRRMSTAKTVSDEDASSPLVFGDDASSSWSNVADGRTDLYQRSLDDIKGRRMVVRFATRLPPTYHGKFGVKPLETMMERSKGPRNIWSPHFVTLRALLQVVSKLQQGYIPRPTTPGERRAPAYHRRQDFEKATEMLNHLEKEYPDAFRAVMNYRDHEMARLKNRFAMIYEEINFSSLDRGRAHEDEWRVDESFYGEVEDEEAPETERGDEHLDSAVEPRSAHGGTTSH